MRDAFGEQATVLADAGAVGIVIETMSDIEEAVIAVAAANRTMTGVTPTQAAQRLAAAGAEVIGAGCGIGVEAAASICVELASATTLPVWIKPNAGGPELVGHEVVYRMTPAQFASHVGAILAAGADFVGGCSGTTPEFIAAVARANFGG